MYVGRLYALLKNFLYFIFFFFINTPRSAQGRGSHSVRGANAPLTFGPMAPKCEHAPPTFSAANCLYGSHGDENCPSFQSSLTFKM